VTSATGTLAVDAALTLRHGLSGDPRDLAAGSAERAGGLLQHARPVPGVLASLPGRSERWGFGGHFGAPT
jgi:hypothetical protein